MQGKPRVQALLIFDGFDEGFWRSVTQAGVALAIGLVMWLVCHYGIRLFVHPSSWQGGDQVITWIDSQIERSLVVPMAVSSGYVLPIDPT